MHKKSIVLYCGGFHLNDEFHVDFLYIALSFSYLFFPIAKLPGVNINPSVLYSNRPSITLPSIVLQPSNILLLLYLG